MLTCVTETTDTGLTWEMSFTNGTVVTIGTFVRGSSTVGDTYTRNSVVIELTNIGDRLSSTLTDVATLDNFTAFVCSGSSGQNAAFISIITIGW